MTEKLKGWKIYETYGIGIINLRSIKPSFIELYAKILKYGYVPEVTIKAKDEYIITLIGSSVQFYEFLLKAGEKIKQIC